MKTLFLVYEKGQVEELERFWREKPETRTDSLVVATKPEIEERLKERNIRHISGRDFRPLDSSRFTVSEEWTAAVLRSREWEWFQYRDVPFADMFFFPIQYCLIQALYYGTIIENVAKAYPSMRTLVVFPTIQGVPRQGRPLDRARIAATVDSARLIGAKYGFEVVVPELLKHPDRMSLNVYTSLVKQAFLEVAIYVWNIGMSLFRTGGTPRILASDYWRNIFPIVSRLPHGELVLFDRAEALKAGFVKLWRYRVRLYNFSSFSGRSRKQNRLETQRRFEKQWSDIRAKNALPECLLGGVSLTPLLAGILDDLIQNETPKTLRNIDGAYALLAATTPDMVFLRTSFSTQSHFYILALVARALGTPSLEIQHGLEYLGPGSISKKHSAEYIAIYGKIVQDEFAALGVPREKLPIVGSPRFDSYIGKSAQSQKARSKNSTTSVLCIGFTADAESMYDDYDVREYYGAVARAFEKVPNVSVVIKLRPGAPPESRSVVDDIFARVPHTIAQKELLSDLLPSADIVVSYYSTAVLEALQFKKPVVLFDAQRMGAEQIRFHFTTYEEMNACRIADTQEDLESVVRSLATDSASRDQLAQGAGEALSRLHTFDGKASKRIVELIERLSRKNHE